MPERLGAFRIVGVLGKGGSAVVYAAFRDAEPVALKVPHEQDGLTEKQQRRFLQEARMLARIRHDAVIGVVDAGRLPDGRPYVAMRRHEGETLASYLLQHGPLELAHALQLFDELADAAAALHDADLVHRDIKPENVLLVDAAAHVKLLDFGIAKDLGAPASTTTQAGIAKGTPSVMAPERFFGAAASTQTDVYELAVVLYVMLVGRAPWPDAADASARLNPAPPSENGTSLPYALSEEIMRALSTRPEMRPANAREFARRVREAARSTEAPPTRITAAITCGPDAPKVSETGSGGVQVLDSPGADNVRSAWTRVAVVALVIVVIATTAVLLGIHWAGRYLASPDAEVAHTASAAPERSASVLMPDAREFASASTPVQPTPDPAVSREPPPRATPSFRPPSTTSVRPPSVPPPSPTPAGAVTGKPKGASCARSSECRSMLCAAETCQ
jgi:serine/threonine protein kinase